MNTFYIMVEETKHSLELYHFICQQRMDVDNSDDEADLKFEISMNVEYESDDDD